MNPYELRFNIYQEARKVLENEYHYKHDLALTKINRLGSYDKIPENYYPEYPSEERIEELAKKINNFVNSKEA